jgi:hypothetical protein
MGWWSDFDRPEVAADFARIAASGLDSVRIFLTWADFQPTPNQVDRRMLDRLIAVADLAAGSGPRARSHSLHRSHERRELDSGVGARAGLIATSAFVSCPTAGSPERAA